MQTAKHLAHHVSSLRRRRGISQAQLAATAGLPRSTLTHIESGQGNPSLSNLIKLAGALQVGVEELLGPPEQDARHIRAEKVPVVRKSGGAVEAHKLMPYRIRGIEIDRMEFAPGAVMGGTPHVSGTREFLTVIRGEIEVRVDGQNHSLKPGDVLAFRGDQPHSYRNPGRTRSAGVSVVIPIPSALIG